MDVYVYSSYACSDQACQLDPLVVNNVGFPSNFVSFMLNQESLKSHLCIVTRPHLDNVARPKDKNSSTSSTFETKSVG